ncbi:DNA-3-methyladenine glycosylase I [Parapedobacter composti]|uniref:DNA-3-methyladenine glycosylase I n=1 Tax=Parapedobacter composti TaxID=623281 RepID=UPI000B24D71D|nr:DNA-3-methyladenine glycosylase I [Parapedobacter composti]
MQSEEKKALHKKYHDNYYGFPIHDDNELFGRLIMEINQAGLSWETILKKETSFRTHTAISTSKKLRITQKQIQRCPQTHKRRSVRAGTRSKVY